jgi:hypothetical protein
MSELVIVGIVFGCAFGGALVGMFVAGHLPKHHLDADSKDVVKAAMAMVATVAALIVGLLIASAKGSFDNKDNELKHLAAYIVLLDRAMAQYGAETMEIRSLFRQIIAMRISQIWSEGDNDEVATELVGQGPGLEEIQRKVLDLSPQNDEQRWLKSTALQMTNEIAEARLLVLEELGSSIQWPFLAILVFWVAMIFASFGLFAPRNGIAVAVLLISSLSVTGALYLIVEMDQPYSGLIKISSAPMRAALNQLGR